MVHSTQLLIFILALLHHVSPLSSTAIIEKVARQTACPPGTFQQFDDCKPCPIATFTSVTGAQGPDLCQPCPAGTFSLSSALTSISQCEPCPAGTSSVPGTSSCMSCPAGSILMQKRRTTICETCRAGTFSALPNSLSCTPCPKGLSSLRNASACVPCGPGKESFKGRCFPCSRNTFNDGTMSSCSFCPPGLISLPARAATSCTSCPLRKAPTFFGCTKCPPGQNELQPRPACVPNNTPCPFGFFQASDNICRQCTPLQRYDKLQNTCIDCGSNTVSLGGLSPTCTSCPADRIGVNGKCICPDGYFGGLLGACTPCPAGFEFYRISTGEGKCRTCTTGTFSASPASLTCTPCPPKQVQPADAQTSCFECPADLVASTLFFSEYPSMAHLSDQKRFRDIQAGKIASRSACVSSSTNCPPDTERVTDGFGRFFCAPKECQDGTFEVMTGPMAFTSAFERSISGTRSFDIEVRACLSCPVGSFLDAENGRCVPCKNGKEGSVSQGGIVRECQKCGKNLFAAFAMDGRSQTCACLNSGEGPRVRNTVQLLDGMCKPCGRGNVGVYGTSVCAECGTVGVVLREECKLFCARGFAGKFGQGCRSCEEGTTSYGLGEEKCVPINGM